jgi:hypothetical protein
MLTLLRCCTDIYTVMYTLHCHTTQSGPVFQAPFTIAYTANLAELAAKNWTAAQHEADLMTALSEINQRLYDAPDHDNMRAQHNAPATQMPAIAVQGGPALVFQTTFSR